MKKTKMVLLLMMMAIFSLHLAATEPKKVNSKIEKVTVFLQGAQIVRTATTTIPAGITDIIFEGVSPNLNTGSLQASGKGNFVVMGIRYNTEYNAPGVIKENAVPPALLHKIDLTRDSLLIADFAQENINYRLQAWTMEKSMLERNKLITGEGKTDSLALFIQAMDYYRKKIHEINQKIVETKIEQQKHQKIRSAMTARLTELVNYKNRLEKENVTQASYSYQVIVTVSASSATSGTLNINYLVGNASWSPVYELRANNSTSPIDLHYKALITQNTGESWDKVQLKLSTVNPSRQHAKPSLISWILRYYQPPVNIGYTISNAAMPVTESVRKDEVRVSSNDSNTSSYEVAAKSISGYTQQSITFSNVEFEIDLPYTIPSDGKQHQVTVLEEKIDAQYKHYIVPKIELEAFLMARLTGWEHLNLLPGTANIYFQNTIIGATHIDPNSISDTLNISLGRDPGLSVERKKLKDKESTKVLSNDIEKQIVIEITVKNKKGEPTQVQIEDQIPITTEQDIKIKYTKDGLAGAEHNAQTGALIWNMNLKAGESKTITFRYTIAYPKDKNLVL